MKVLQVLTWVGPGNPFGGPLRVAMNQVDELRRLGHDVELIAAQPRPSGRIGWDASTIGAHAFDAWRVLPGAGFSGVVSPTMLRAARRRIRQVDVVHVHLARDLVTLPVAALARHAGVPYVLQPHGMVDPSDKLLARVLDGALTRRVMSGAADVFVLSPTERSDVLRMMGGAPVHLTELPNGVPVVADPVPPPADRVEALFCSRLHARKRPLLFATAAAELLAGGSDAAFALVGPDEGELPAVQAVIDDVARPDRLTREGPVEPAAALARLARCAVLVLPSVDEPFPMIVLEALSLGRPVIISDSCGLAPFVRGHDCGIVVPGDDRPALVQGLSRLLADEPLRRTMGERGRTAVQRELSMAAVATRLEAAYTAAAAHRPR